MAADEKGPVTGWPPSFRKAPLPPDAGALALGLGTCGPLADPPLDLAQPVPMPAGLPDFGMPLKEATSQDLTEEPLCKRPCHICEPLPWGGGRLLSVPFPRKLWTIVNSDHFTSVGWDPDGTCIGINEQLFQKEVLDRDGPEKVFVTGRMKSFVRQLNLYGFSKLRQDKHADIGLSNFFSGERPIYMLGKFYRCPLFKRDCPQLLERMKRRVGVKSASRTLEGQLAALGYPLAPTTSEPPDGLAPSPADTRGTPRHPGCHHASPLAGTDSAHPAPPGMAAEPPAMDANAWQPEGVRAHGPPAPVLAEVALPDEVPWLCFTWPPSQVTLPGPVLALAAAPPRLLGPPPRQLPAAVLLPVYRHWTPLVAAGPAAPLALIPQPPSPFCCHPGSCCFPRAPGPSGRAPRGPGAGSLCAQIGAGTH
ncbi:heat shock transcription factor, X-linked [Hippopotamus amphibius kiboko]|uniref:heat shock transcription factor, X-linked n=1 Tax=Hippopotamus amphibius kiboko TaxID=575201 RepID=UPI002597C4D7|nr:heat shock transcription factor, X-linked [Hippopotamus amphibius kiboko]